MYVGQPVDIQGKCFVALFNGFLIGFTLYYCVGILVDLEDIFRLSRIVKTAFILVDLFC